MLHYYLDRAGRPRNPATHQSLRTAAVKADPDALRVLHPRDAAAIGRPPDAAWTEDAQAQADLVRAGLEAPAPAPAPDPPPPPEIAEETAPADAPADLEAPAEAAAPAPDPALAGEAEPLPEPYTPPAPAPDPAPDVTPDAAPDATAAAPENAEETPDNVAELFEDGGDADTGCPDPSCPICNSGLQTCSAGHRYATISREESDGLIYLIDSLVCAGRTKKSGRLVVPIVGMSTPEACAAMGLPPGSERAAEAMLAAMHKVAVRRGAFFAEYADLIGAIGAAVMLEKVRAMAVPAQAAAA